MHAPWPSIPGETPIDLSHLTANAKARGVATRQELSTLEALNIAKAFIKYLAGKPSSRMAPFDYSWSLKLHKEMFGEVWDWAGSVRTADGNIGVPFYNVSGMLYSLLTDLQEWGDFDMPLVEQAARLHHRAVAIHPFPNGNGRWSRLLANIWLRQRDAPLTQWREEGIGEQGSFRREYIATIRAADAGDLTPLIELHARYTFP